MTAAEAVADADLVLLALPLGKHRAVPTGPLAGRKAIGIASDDTEDGAAVAHFVDSLGFEPVVVGRLADGVRLRPGTEAFGANAQADELRAIVDRFPDPAMSGSESGELLLPK